ncbi:hypothetical protein ZEAMMB73_Zm00001d040563 [Zea mays]|uniref:Uncharacterized protein n=1 Tax=Zea mays TaxID=4577 RepID=A0A1D6MRE9_MAIZE|nr:hypothetical protein ZEAMMB73_Zm00001d040563 [Zea mays]ONM31554.1 hypothetical protein ZEAMMB73_Zm00001d040563 [Zea mays]
MPCPPSPMPSPSPQAGSLSRLAWLYVVGRLWRDVQTGRSCPASSRRAPATSRRCS